MLDIVGGHHLASTHESHSLRIVDTMSTSCSSVTEASTGSSLFETVSSAFSSFFPTAHADEGKEDDDEEGEDDSKDDKEDGGDDEEEGGDDEEDEEDEPEDPMPAIYECELDLMFRF